VTLPGLGTSLVAGALLAFALSFDEIVVTTFTSGPGIQTLPIWIFSNYSRSQQLPLVNVASVLVLLLSVIPVYIAARISSDPAAVTGGRRGGSPAPSVDQYQRHRDEREQRPHAGTDARHRAPPRPARPVPPPLADPSRSARSERGGASIPAGA
jgi:hypothetical protein